LHPISVYIYYLRAAFFPRLIDGKGGILGGII